MRTGFLIFLCCLSTALSFISGQRPQTVAIDKSKAVGEIGITSVVTRSGSKTYDVPINGIEGFGGFGPELSLSYNSQSGNSIVGFGWAINGLSSITRSGHSIFFDGRVRSVEYSDSDNFIFDGIRLIKTSSENIFQTFVGNIRAKANYDGSVLTHFDVYYPDGRQAVFGFSDSYIDNMIYPITLMRDSRGNRIEYQYDAVSNHYEIRHVGYSGVSVDFEYGCDRADEILGAHAGRMDRVGNLLREISVKFNGSEVKRYSLTHENNDGYSFLTQIDLSSGKEELNPLRFYYGTNSAPDNQYGNTRHELDKWIVPGKNEDVRLTSGKFDYRSNHTGLVMVLSKNPYQKKSASKIVNKYDGDEDIYVYRSLDGYRINTSSEIKTGEAFIDILCADIDGTQNDYIVRINNTVVDGMDEVRFSVYRNDISEELTTVYERSYQFNTVYNGCIQPKYYYAGDFDGDGKQEIFVVGSALALSTGSMPTWCYLIDIADNTVIRSSQFNFFHELIWEKRTDATFVQENSDKIYVFDFDADGKDDILHIASDHASVFSFKDYGHGLLPQRVGYSADLSRKNLKGRSVMPVELNGDGLMDLLVSPAVSGDYEWFAYYSNGINGFEKRSFRCGRVSKPTVTTLIAHDVNCDGITDLIDADSEGFRTLLASDNIIGEEIVSTVKYKDSDKGSVLIPVDINSNSVHTQLIAYKNGIINKYTFKRDVSKTRLLTCVANSFGVVEHNDFKLLTDCRITEFKQGEGAKYPYVNINEPIPVLVETKTFVDGFKTNYDRYVYENAVMHRQGLGFVGFSSIEKIDFRNQRSKTEYDPYGYGVVRRSVSKSAEVNFDYDIKLTDDRRLKINLVSKNSVDNPTGNTSTTTYSHDEYGNVLTERIDSSDGHSVTTENSYNHNPVTGDTYYVGIKSGVTKTMTSGGRTLSERTVVGRYDGLLPAEVITCQGDAESGRETVVYDERGNVTQKTTTKFGSTNALTEKFEYDSFGRRTRETDVKGRSTTFVYDSDSPWLKSKTDFRGNEWTYGYDPFGRLVRETTPTGLITGTTYRWAGDGKCLYYVDRKNIDESTSAGYDALGREVISSRDLATLVTYRLKEYDSYGRLSKESLPVEGDGIGWARPLTSVEIWPPVGGDDSDKADWATGADTVWITYDYDLFDRVSSKTWSTGKTVTYSYSGNEQTVTENGITTTTVSDSRGNVTSVTDNSGTVSYEYAPDGKPLKVTAHGTAVTTFGYDTFRRKISMTDPSNGTTTYAYDTDGNLSTVTNARGQETTYGYDRYGLLGYVSGADYFADYLYDSSDRIINSVIDPTSGFRTEKSYTYDNVGRVTSETITVPDMKWLRRDYTYGVTAKPATITYTSNLGKLLTEHYYHVNGEVVEITLDDDDEPVFALTNQTATGKPTWAKTGPLTRRYRYDKLGYPVERAVTLYPEGMTPGSEDAWVWSDEAPADAPSPTYFQRFFYKFDQDRSNLLSRKDYIRGTEEEFSYDEMNRLAGYGTRTVDYDEKGNIVSKSDAGRMDYTHASKPYAVTRLTPAVDDIDTGDQTITYTSFDRPFTIKENGRTATFDYDEEFNRTRMTVTAGRTRELTRYYIGDRYESDVTPGGTVERLYIGGDAYTAPVVVVRQNGQNKVYYLGRDYLGSITRVIDEDLNVVEETSYDAWGRLRDPSTLEVYAQGEEPELMLGRGYTGHEHLPRFGLINMNARLYDPVLGRFLSPDPFVQMPYMTQNFNRYSYALNNPMVYVDENGEFFWAAVGIGALIGGVVNVAIHWDEINSPGGGFMRGLGYFGIGALAGGVGTAAAIIATQGLGAVAAFSASSLGAASNSFTEAMWFGALDGGISGFVLESSNALYNGANSSEAFLSGLSAAGIGGFGGALLGGATWGAQKIATNIKNVLNKNKLLASDETLKKMAEGFQSTMSETVTTPTSGKKEQISVYVRRNAETREINYFGITNNYERRVGEHQSLAPFGVKYKFGDIITVPNRLNARILEQNFINEFGGPDIFLNNKINSIVPKYWQQYGIPPVKY